MLTSDDLGSPAAEPLGHPQRGRRMTEPEGQLAMDFRALGTEAPHPQTTELDTLSALELVTTMNDADATVPAAVRAALPEIARAVELVVAARRRGGRLIYLGAGTSGRLGLLDAVECPPTFGVAPGEVVGLLAGGAGAFVQAVEGAEDEPERGVADLEDIGLTADDVLVGLAASGRTPYVAGGLGYARRVGAGTVAVSCNARARISALADVAIEVETGPEVLTGSTRLKAGTAQKMVCNMISTAAMVRTGKAYGNLMVDVRATNAKLRDRAVRIVARAAEVDPAVADEALQAAAGHPKTAIVMLLTDTTPEQARDLLARHDDHLRPAVEQRSQP